MSGTEPRVDRRPTLASRFWHRGLRDERIGVMLHFDASTTDAGAEAWFRKEGLRAGYHYLVLDDGTVLGLAPFLTRAWHAGTCRPSDGLRYADANSAFLGVSIAATTGHIATYPQARSVARICQEIFAHYGWPLTDSWRVTTHMAEAWPRGRRQDPGKVLPREWVLEQMICAGGQH